jgi:hypothetical protein
MQESYDRIILCQSVHESVAKEIIAQAKALQPAAAHYSPSSRSMETDIAELRAISRISPIRMDLSMQWRRGSLRREALC